MNKTKKGEIVIYKTLEGPEVRVNLQDETIWATQAQIAQLFDTDRSSITKHLKNIIKTGELSEKSNVQKLHIANSDKPVKSYNLDFIIAVGYKVNSKKATQFRVWATQQLKQIILKGYVVDKQRLKKLEAEHTSLKELEQANKLFRQVIESHRAEGYERDLLSIITDYTNTWFVLNRYDQGGLAIENITVKKPRLLDYQEIQKSIEKFKARLVAKKEAGDLFGREVGGKFAGALGSISQTFGGKDLYPSLEEKAAHLLYFCIKDHPFADGNKRISSLLFLLFLVENNYLINRRGERKINDSALAALALLIAESDPGQKDVMVKLVVNLINKK